MRKVVGCMTLFLWTLCGADSYVLNEHQKFILNGVETIWKTCLPATMVLLNENSYPILTGDDGGVSKAHVAATEFGDGRIVAFSHTSFYVNNLPDGIENDNVKLFINSVKWVQKDRGHKIGVFAEKATENVLTEQGFEIEVLTTNSIANSTLLQQFDVVVCGRCAADTAPTNLRDFVRSGGGLLLGATSWTAHPDDLQSYYGNVILQDSGIFYITSGSYGSESCNYNCFDTSTDRLQDTNAYLVWQDLKDFDWRGTMPRERLTQMMDVLFDQLLSAPRNETLIDHIDDEAHRILKYIPITVPTPIAPLVEENERAHIIYHRYWTMLLNVIGKTDNIPPHPAAESFPGAASLRSRYRKGRRVHEIVEINASIKWFSTGLYAQPGDEIKIQAIDANSSMSGLYVQIGIHSDNIEKVEQWTRCPYIVYKNEIKNGVATIANPFGGLISIGSSTQHNVSSKFLIDGGIRSPSYFLGTTKPDEWTSKIRNNPAPWGELIGKKLIISMQSSLLKQLDNPQEVIEQWDLIMDTIADLAVISHERDTPFRIVPDVQIGGGWMHSGYPIMVHLESQSEMINITQMNADPWTIWGFLHEIGHNHQKQDWNFKGTGEVTCNLFALYVLHTLFDCPTNSTGSYSDASVAKRLKIYVEDGKHFSEWQSNYDLAFDTYVQLQKVYGWSAYKTVFANYQLLTEDERPTNDEERINMWMVMFSRAVEENMAEFFISWGFPISSKTIELVENLPPTSLRIPDVENV